jgi:hypothetical protein
MATVLRFGGELFGRDHAELREIHFGSCSPFDRFRAALPLSACRLDERSSPVLHALPHGSI